MKEFPQFVKINTIVLRLDGTKYHSDNGAWSIGYKRVYDVLLADCAHYKEWHNQRLIPATEEEYRKCVGNYAVI